MSSKEESAVKFKGEIDALFGTRARGPTSFLRRLKLTCDMQFTAYNLALICFVPFLVLSNVFLSFPCHHTGHARPVTEPLRVELGQLS
jgi:hypothetical protein